MTRIEELARQAGYKQDMFGIGHWDIPEFQEFVRLLLSDVENHCIQVEAEYQSNRKLAYDPEDKDIYREGEACSSRIRLWLKRHFGVE